MAFELTSATQEIHDFISTIGETGGKVGALRIGQQKRGDGITSHFALTLNKADFAGMMKRINAYQHIPEAGRYAMIDVQGYIQKTILPSRFDTEGKGTGNGWPALEDSTNKWRKKAGGRPEHPILQVQSFYKNALLSGDPWKIPRIGKAARLEFDPEKLSPTPSTYPGIKKQKLSVRDKFFVHQLGAVNQYGNKIPQRRVFPTFASDFTTAQKREIEVRLTTGVLDYLVSEYHHARIGQRKIRRIG